MKKLFLFFTFIIILIPLHKALSQTLNNYISSVKGDTLVIKDYYDINHHANSLYEAMRLDTVNVPASRVYELKANGYYPLEKNPTTLRNTVIAGEDNSILVKNGNVNSRPPLICGTDSTNGIPFPNAAAINVTHDLTVKNCNIIALSPKGFVSYSIINPISANLKITFDNCLVEHLSKDFLLINQANYNVTLRNCYFVNMNGWACRRSGGVFDCLSELDTLLVENCTHIMAQGSVYRLRDYLVSNHSFHIKKVIFNHNTFVNCAGYTFMNPGYQSNVSLTNNMFINCNIQPYSNFIFTHDLGEVDPANLPMGLVNVYPDSADVANNTPRKFLCQNNLVYWDPSLANIASTLNANAIDGLTNWRSQMIIMNTRTDSMFKHLGHYNTTPYSYLVTDTWKNQLPTFINSKDLLTTQLANLKAFAIDIMDSTKFTTVLPTWRLINTGSDGYFKSDWPIPVDLSYSDANLLTGGMGGFPIGDLNWFPDKKTQWLVQKTAEYSNLNIALNSGRLVTAVQYQSSLPAEFKLMQNYPNPFNPTTRINYQLPLISKVSIKVFDILGREIATLVNEEQPAGNHEIIFDGNKLTSGIYFYRMQSGDFVQTKKLILLK